MARQKQDSDDMVTTEAAAAQVVTLNLDELAALVAKMNGGGSGNSDMAAAIMRLANEHTRGKRPENAENPRISAFSYPEGETAKPKSRLARETFFCGVKQSEEQLMPLEIDLFNQIDESKSARNGAWTAELEVAKMGGRGRLIVNVPARNTDDIMNLPPLVQILTELATGQSATDVAQLMQQVAEMQKKLDALNAGAAVAV